MEPFGCGNHVWHRRRNPIAPKNVGLVVHGPRQGSAVVSQIGFGFRFSVVGSEAALIAVVVVVDIIVVIIEGSAAELNEAVEDLVDGAAVDVEGGDGHEVGSEKSGHGEVKRVSERGR